MACSTLVTIAVSPDLAEQLPAGADALAEVLALRLKSWRIEHALDGLRGDHGTVAYAAEQAGVSIREMIAWAYAYGLQPNVDPGLTDQPLSIEQASSL